MVVGGTHPRRRRATLGQRGGTQALGQWALSSLSSSGRGRGVAPVRLGDTDHFRGRTVSVLY